MFNRSEKRQFERFRHQEPVEIHLQDSGIPKGSLAGDLSGGGVRVHLNEFIPANTPIALNIKLRDGRVIECPGRVAWVTKNRFNDNYQAGLEFVGDKSLASIRKLINGYFDT